MTYIMKDKCECGGTIRVIPIEILDSNYKKVVVVDYAGCETCGKAVILDGSELKDLVRQGEIIRVANY